MELAELVRPGGLADGRATPQVDGVRLPTELVLKVEGDSEEMEAIEGGGLLPRKRRHGISTCLARKNYSRHIQLPCLRWLVTHADIGDSGGGGGGGRALPLEVVVVDEMTEAVAGGAGWSPFRLLDEDGTSEETSVLLD
jgi:hypothetical protein